MPEPSPPPASRARRRSLVARAAALCAAGLLAATTALPAAALGEDGPFPFPAETTSLPIVPGSVTRIPLVALIEDELESEVDLDSARLAVPSELEGSLASTMELGEDSRSITIEGEGTWTLLGRRLVFTPLFGVTDPTTPIALSIGSEFDSRSVPVVLTPERLDLERIPARGSAEEATTIDIEGAIPDGGAVRLVPAGLPAGSTVQADGSRAHVPDQGSWQLAADGSTLTHTPSGPGPGRQLDPIRYVVVDEEGLVQRAGEVTLTVPIISDQDWSAPFGEDIVFVVGEAQQHVDPATLRLQPLGAPDTYGASADGTRVVVPGEGTWALNRSQATVRFSPESAEVREVAPMGITGGDGQGHTASIALLSTAYPILLSRSRAAVPGEPIRFDLSTGIRDVRSDSLRFDPDALPDGAELAEDGTVLTVPEQGTWRMDLEDREVLMTPVEGFVGPAAPVGITARGVYADNAVSATLEAVVSPVIATLRDDEGRTAPGVPVTVDVLGNDTAGDASQPLDPESVLISSLSTTNLSRLEEGRGTRLQLPGQGEFTVGANGAVTFTPAEGFVGRTTPISYQVTDSAGVTVRAQLVIDVAPELAASADDGPEVSGINSLLVGLMPDSPGTAVVFAAIVVLLLFGGSLSLAIGLRMDADRRAWED